MGIAVVSKQLQICYLVSKQLKKTFSQLIGKVESPADVKIDYRVGFPNKSLP